MSPKKMSVVLELERVFNHFNEKLFDNRLSMPTHVLQPDKKVVFRFVAESYSMIVGAKFCGLTLNELACHYLHDMVHIANFRQHLIDCTSNQYHNKNYLAAAREIGFHVLRHKTQGWSLTKFARPSRRPEKDYVAPDDKNEAIRQTAVESLKLDMGIIQESQSQMRRYLKQNRPKPCFLKYVCQCPPPHNSVRSGRRPNGTNAPKIKCEVCGSKFEFSGE